MQLSSFIGKLVLSPAGERCGYVVAARPTRDFAEIACLVCADGEEEEFYLPGRAILSVRDAVIAEKRRIAAPAGVPSPVGTEAYTIAGTLLGTIADVRLKEQGDPAFIIAGEHALTQVPVLRVALGERAVVYPEGASVPAAKRAPRARKKPAESKKEAPMSEEQAPKTMQLEPAPVKAELLNGSNLLGKRVRRSVFEGCGLPIAVAGERVTPAILSRARRKNCLIRLAVNTLTNL